MKEQIATALKNLGFVIQQENDSSIIGEIESFNNGTFNIIVDLRDQTFTVQLIQQFSRTHIFLIQKFTDAEYIVNLLHGNYPFQEWILENDGSVEKMFKEYAIANRRLDLL